MFKLKTQIKDKLLFLTYVLSAAVGVNASAYEFIHPKRSKCLEPAGMDGLCTLANMEYRKINDQSQP